MFRIDKHLVKVVQPADIPVIPIKLPPGDEPKTVAAAVAAANAQAMEKARVAAVAAATEENADAEAKTRVGMILQDAQNASDDILNEARIAAGALISDAKRTAEGRITAILREAESLAQEKLREADKQIKAIHDSARQAGYKEGYDEGLQHGYDKGKNEALQISMEQNRAAQQQISDLLTEITAAREAYFNSIEAEIIDLALAVAAKITHTALQKDDTALNAIIINALRQMRRQGKITIRISEEQYNTFFNAESATFVLGDESISAAILGDPALDDGDILLEAEGETVNAGVDSQLKYLALALGCPQQG